MARNQLFDGNIQISLTGDKELIAKLNTLPSRVHKRILKKGLTYAGRRIRKDIRDNVPMDTKTLKKSIGTVVRTYKENLLLIVGPRKGFVAPNGERADKYMIGIEKGWKGREPKPIVRNAYERAKATVPDDFKIGIGNGIEKEAQKSG